MAALKDHHKEFIIKQLACYCSPKEIQESVRELFNMELSTSQIVYYDPDTARSMGIAEKWRRMHRATRDKYLQEAVKVPIFHKAYRLNQMQSNYEKAKGSGNIVLAQQILVDAAKEVGGAHERNDLPSGDGQTVNNYIQQIYNRIENGRT